MPDADNIHDRSVLEYRVRKLEEALLKLSGVADVVTRWDERFSAQGGVMQCSIHALRMDEHEEKIKALEKDVAEIKALIYKGIGAFFIISILMQLFGPWIVALLKAKL